MKKSVLGSLVLAALLALTGFAARAQDTVRFGVAAEPYPPFESKDASGKWVGFEIDLMDAVCAEIKANCSIVEVAWDGIIPALQANKFDVIWSSMLITDKRKETIDFTDKYYRTPAEIIGPKSVAYNIDFKNPDSLKGKIVGVQTNTAHARFMTKYFGNAITLKIYDTQDNVNADLVAGRLDLEMADAIVLDGFLKSDQGKDFEVKGKPPTDDPVVFGYGVGGGVRKTDSDLREKLNKAIAAIRANGTYEAIAKKYFNFDVYGG
jgi:polar amino acid transport system substrate-binding protein